MTNSNTLARRAKATRYVREWAPLRELDLLLSMVRMIHETPRPAAQRQRLAMAKAARVLLAAGIGGLPPDLAWLLREYEGHTPEDEKGPDFVHLLTRIATYTPSPYDLALSRSCPDERARFAFAFAHYAQRRFGARVVLEAAIAWGIEPPPPPAREHALLRAWEGRVAKARSLVARTRASRPTPK